MASGIVESGPQSSSAQQGSARARLLQRIVAGSTNLPQFINDLVTTQIVVVAGTEGVGFLVERRDDGIALQTIAHLRPDDSSAEMRAAAIKAFQDILKPCLAQGKDAAIEVASDSTREPQFCLVTLLRSEGQIVAASAVITCCHDLERAQQRLVSMQLVAGYFEMYTLRRTNEQSQIVAQSHQHVLQLATAVATAEGFQSAAVNLCNELATRTGSTRVTLGWVKGHDIKVSALSHTEEFDKKQELIRILESVMEECIDQEEMVHYDPDGGGTKNVARSAQVLSRTEGGTIVLSLPLRRRAEVVGAITLEFPSNHKLSPQASTGLAVTVDLLAPQLYDRYQNDRWLITKAGISAKDTWGKVTGPHFMVAKLIALASAIALLLIWWIRPMYHVTAPFTFDSIDKRKLEAPFDGYIKLVNVKPGDVIKQGQILATMDTSDIELKLASAEADASKARAEFVKSASDPTKQADASIASAELDAAQADAHLYQDQIDRSKIRAPFDGRVLNGDLSDQILTPKKQGDELFIVAATSSLRAKIMVNDRDIQELRSNGPPQHGELTTTSFPTKKIPFTIERIVPLAQAQEGENVFTVYASMDQSDPSWRPGLSGEAHIDIEKRSVIWIWTHRFVDFVRLKLWM